MSGLMAEFLLGFTQNSIPIKTIKMLLDVFNAKLNGREFQAICTR
jgi:hypothetical protein